MTTVVTRLYESLEMAEAMAGHLQGLGFPASTMDIIQQSGSSSAMERMDEARVSGQASEVYAQQLTAQRALLVVRAPDTPFGAARTAMIAVDQFPSVEVDLDSQNQFLSDNLKAEYGSSVLTSHRMWLTNPMETRNGTTSRGLSASFGIPMLLARKASGQMSIIPGGRFLSSIFFPMALISPRKRSSSVMSGGRRMFG